MLMLLLLLPPLIEVLLLLIIAVISAIISTTATTPNKVSISIKVPTTTAAGRQTPAYSLRNLLHNKIRPCAQEGDLDERHAFPWPTTHNWLKTAK